jgi:hypothetical protein
MKLLIMESSDHKILISFKMLFILYIFAITILCMYHKFKMKTEFTVNSSRVDNFSVEPYKKTEPK